MITNLVDQLRRDEGVRNMPYVDTVGKVTIGVGRNLTDVGLSDSEVIQLLQNDIDKVTAQLAPYQWYNTMDSVRQGAIQNMAFNLGINGLLHFPHMIAALARSDWATAAQEMSSSLWASQVGPRAVRLQQQILTGVWQ
jgi:lysozyme